MEDSASIRRRTSRNARELTPEPTRKLRISKSSDREIKSDLKESEAVDESKYVVRGILNVGPPSPAGSASSSSSSGNSANAGGNVGGSQAYRAKILRYFATHFRVPRVVLGCVDASNHQHINSRKNLPISSIFFSLNPTKQKREKHGTSSSSESINLPAIGIVSNQQ
jgi:hypothetical protein